MMPNKIINNSAFSLLEILLASMIFIITIAGVFTTLDFVRRPVIDKESSLAAAVFGKQVLEALRSKVDARTYYAPCSTDPSPDPCPDFTLSLGHHRITDLTGSGLSWPPRWKPASNSLSYIVTCADASLPADCGADVARRVDLNINWPDAP